MPTYGRSFTLSNPNNFKVNSPASGGGKAGEYTKESGFLAYYEVIIIKKYYANQEHELLRHVYEFSSVREEAKLLKKVKRNLYS